MAPVPVLSFVFFISALYYSAFAAVCQVPVALFFGVGAAFPGVGGFILPSGCLSGGLFLPFPALSSPREELSPPSPRPPSPPGKGETVSLFLQGASPLASLHCAGRSTAYRVGFRCRRSAYPRRCLLAPPRGREPSQTPPSRQRRIVPSPPVPLSLAAPSRKEAETFL